MILRASFDPSAALAAIDSHQIRSGSLFVQDVIQQHAALKGLACLPAVLEAAGKLLGGTPRRYFDHFIVSHPGAEPVTKDWHQDRPPASGFGVKAHFYLTSTRTEQDGPIRVSTIKPEHPTDGSPCYLEAGDILLLRTDVWHRSMTVQAGGATRKAFYVSYGL